jgi:hypothetical protein
VLLRRALLILTLLSLLIVTSAYLELLGHRILDPDLSITDVWNMIFIAGSLRTAGGSVAMGLLFIAIGYIPKKMREWTKSYWILIWSTGAALFLLVMAGLIYWVS